MVQHTVTGLLVFSIINLHILFFISGKKMISITTILMPHKLCDCGSIISSFPLQPQHVDTIKLSSDASIDQATPVTQRGHVIWVTGKATGLYVSYTSSPTPQKHTSAITEAGLYSARRVSH